MWGWFGEMWACLAVEYKEVRREKMAAHREILRDGIKFPRRQGALESPGRGSGLTRREKNL